MENSNNTQTSSNISLISRKCSVCGSKYHTRIYDQPTENIAGIGDIGYHHVINACDDCGFVFASPILPVDIILKYYTSMSNYEHFESDGARPAADIRQIERQIDIIESRFPSGFKGRALDIGCSIAYGLSLLQESGWLVLGLDPSEKCIQISRDKLGVRVLEGFFSVELLKKENKFDVIILSHVVEHLVFPEEIIGHLSELLTDDGIIYIEVPNLMRPNNTKCYFGFEHVNFFSPQSLTNLATQNGFLVDSLELFENGKEIHPYYPVIAVTLKKSGALAKIINDKVAATEVVEDYSNKMLSLLSKLNKRIDSIVSTTPHGRLAIWGAAFTQVSY